MVSLKEIGQMNGSMAELHDVDSLGKNYNDFEVAKITGKIVKKEEFKPEDTSIEDMINTPNHYHKGGFDIYEIMQAKLTEEAYKGFCIGNFLKYALRHELKGAPLQDLEKAHFNLERLIEVHKGIKYVPKHKQQTPTGDYIEEYKAALSERSKQVNDLKTSNNYLKQELKAEHEQLLAKTEHVHELQAKLQDFRHRLHKVNDILNELCKFVMTIEQNRLIQEAFEAVDFRDKK